MVVNGVVLLRGELFRAIGRIVDLESELRNGLRMRRIADVGEPRLRRTRDRARLLGDATVREAEDALLRVQYVGLAADRRGANRVPASALLADHPRLALRAAVRVPFEPLADVDDREELERRRLAAHVERVVVRRRPRLMARVLGMSLAVQLLGQRVVEVGGGTNRNWRSVHGVLDVAEVRDTRR